MVWIKKRTETFRQVYFSTLFKGAGLILSALLHTLPSNLFRLSIPLSITGIHLSLRRYVIHHKKDNLP